MNASRLRHIPLLLILLAGLGVRIGWVWRLPTDEASLSSLPDQVEYLQIAQNILQAGELRLYDPRFADVVYAFRMPGYPLFVAALRAEVQWIRLAQAIIDASTILAAYLLARRWMSARSSLFAALLVAVNPFLIFFSGLILTETLFTAMMLWGMVLISRQRPLITWLSGGLLLALSIHLRQSAIALPVLLGIAAEYLPRKEQTKKLHPGWPLPAASTMLLLTALVLHPWAYRNSRVVKTWVWTTTNSGITAYDGLHPGATGASDQSFVQDFPELHSSMMNEVQRSEYLRHLAMKFAKKEPGRVVELAAIKAGRTWSPLPLSDQSRPYRLAGLCYTLPLFALAFAGLIWGRMPGSAKVFLLLPAIYFTAVHALTVGSVRYRIPVEPALAVIAAGVIELLPRRSNDWKRAE